MEDEQVKNSARCVVIVVVVDDMRPITVII